MNESDIRWIAGIIDSEGSISMSINKVKRKNSIILIRNNRLRIKTCDDIIVPYVSFLLRSKYNKLKNGAHEIQLTGKRLKEILQLTIPYLCTKKEHAKTCLESMLIKDGVNSLYSKDEETKWMMLYHKLKILNQRGIERYNDESELDDSYLFTYEWLAGLIDGDGSITSQKYGSGRKSFLKISMTSLKTIKLISKNLDTKYSIQNTQKNKATIGTIKLMSNKMIEIVPKIIKHLKLKNDVLKLAHESILLRQTSVNVIDNNGQRAIRYISNINQQKLHHAFNYKNNISYIIYNINNPIAPNISADMMIFSDEWEKRRETFLSIVENRGQNRHVKYKLRPQNCDLKLITNKITKPFYEKYHYQGHVDSTYNIGTYYRNLLVACMSIKKPTRQNSGDWEISRMVCHSDYRICGLWSYLIKHIITNLLFGKLVTFSDNRLMTGRVYEIMGFKKSRDVRPDYYWVKDDQRHHKSKLRKPSGCVITENELRLAEGYHKIYDFGKKKWEMILK